LAAKRQDTERPINSDNGLPPKQSSALTQVPGADSESVFKCKYGFVTIAKWLNAP
jgi:hypothetical protein